MGNNIKDIQQIKSLIAKGKEMGFLTFEEVNKAVPRGHIAQATHAEGHALRRIPAQILKNVRSLRP